MSGTGALRFRVLLTSASLPEEARRVLVSAHGGFAVDHRPGKEETYFALPGAGILRLGADLKQVALVPTAAEMKDTNLHNTKIWYAPDGTALLSFPANDKGRVFTTSLAGELLNTLARPTESDDLGLPSARDYFLGGGAFVPTDVEFLDGLLYVTTGYSSLDTVLTARVTSYSPLKAAWYDLAFGGRGPAPGPVRHRPRHHRPAGDEADRRGRPGQLRDRPLHAARPVPFHPEDARGLAALRHRLPRAATRSSAALDGPDRSKGAPIYLLEDDRLVSTIFPKDDLGLENFKHIHNAVLRRGGGKLYIIAQAWNPGDFAMLEQVIP